MESREKVIQVMETMSMAQCLGFAYIPVTIVNDALTYLRGDANEIKDPCVHCPTREMYARQFDMHFYGDDCPYFCKGYEIYKGTIKKEEKDEQV